MWTQVSAGNSLHSTTSRTSSTLFCPHLRSNMLTPPIRRPWSATTVSAHVGLSKSSIYFSLLHSPKSSPYVAYFRQQSEMVGKSQMLNLELLRCRRGLWKNTNLNDLASLTALPELFLVIRHSIKILQTTTSHREFTLNWALVSESSVM